MYIAQGTAANILQDRNELLTPLYIDIIIPEQVQLHIYTKRTTEEKDKTVRWKIKEAVNHVFCMRDRFILKNSHSYIAGLTVHDLVVAVGDF